MPILLEFQQKHDSRHGSYVSYRALLHDRTKCAHIYFSLAPFTYDAWKSPEVIARISEVAGVDLVPSIDFEIANINISINNPNVEVALTDDKPQEDELPAVAWHYDSFPFVCVTMLSDCTDMVGGETALRTATGEIMKARGPAMV